MILEDHALFGNIRRKTFADNVAVFKRPVHVDCETSGLKFWKTGYGICATQAILNLSENNAQKTANLPLMLFFT